MCRHADQDLNASTIDEWLSDTSKEGLLSDFVGRRAHKENP